MSKNIYESKAATDAAKRFRMLCEYTFNITEDDGDEMQEPQEMDNDMNNPEEMGGMENGQEGGDMQQQMDGPMQEPNNNEMPNQSIDGADGGAPGFNPQDNNEFGEENFDAEQMQPDDEVIDVDELTKSQEETEEKVEDIHVSMKHGFEKLLGIVDKLDKMIDNNSSNMEEIKREIEKRNPTPLEKLNMRAANDSYPFNISPNDYWKEKEATSNYRIDGSDEPDAEQYIITQNDIDNVTDFRRISKELNDSEYNQNLMNIFNLR